MSRNIAPQSPLSYLGVPPTNPPQVSSFNRAPTSTDAKNFELGAIWLDRLTDSVYMLVDLAQGVATWVSLGGVFSGVETLTIPGPTVITPVSNNINFLNGTGMSITGSGDDVTFTVTAIPAVVPWSVETSANVNITVNQGYFSNSGSGVDFLLPAVAAVGDVFYISNIHASGGWTVSQNAGQNIRIGNQITTTGVGGSLSSSATGDSIFAVCYVANTSFQVVSSMGNITFV